MTGAVAGIGTPTSPLAPSNQPMPFPWTVAAAPTPAPAAPVAPALLRINARPWADVSIDGVARGLVARSRAGEAIEVWAVDRRTNLLEDLTGLDAAERASVLTRHLLAYAQRQVLRPTVFGVGPFLVGVAPLLLVVHPSVPAKSVKELIALAKARPNTLNCAGGVAGASTHLAAELFKSMSGTSIVNVPFEPGTRALAITAKRETIGGNQFTSGKIDSAGKVQVKFVIGAQGNVQSAVVAESSLNNKTAESCMTGKVKGWMFPKPKGGGIVIVTYPFIFKQGG